MAHMKMLMIDLVFGDKFLYRGMEFRRSVGYEEGNGEHRGELGAKCLKRGNFVWILAGETVILVKAEKE